MSKIITLDGLRDYLTNLKRLFVTKTDAESTYATKAENNTKANNSAVVHKSGDETVAGTKTFSKPIVGSVTGNAATATQLQTARTINGTSFNGTANITTTNWGTARDITIADSTGDNTGEAVSVNGSAAVTLKLPATIKASLDGNAATATSATKATQDSDGNEITTTYSKNGHTHDDRYYTENEVDNLLNGKANTSGTYSNLTVGNAGSATNATYANWLRTSSHTDHLFHTEWDKAGYFWTYVTTGGGEYRPVRVARSDSSGNADTATKLATARTINGTSFNGTANITTANWGTARNISITDGTNTSTAVSVNGSANVSLNLPATIKANLTGNCSGSSGSCTGNAASANIATKATQDAAGNTITTTYATKAENNTKANNSEVVHKSGDETIAGTKTFSNGVLLTNVNAFMAQNKGYTLVLRNDGSNTYLLISDKDGVPGTWSSARPFVISNSTGVCDINGNAATATKLQTARTINGTSFNGTANITTTNWGTARNISITDGTNTSTAVSVNGSANVSLNLPSTIKATFVGNVTGNVTGNCSGSSGSCTGNSATATTATNSNAANQLQAFVNDNFTGGNHYVKAIRSSQGWSTHLWMCYNNGAKMADEVSVNYANSAGSANTANSATTATYADWLRTSSHSDHLFHTEWDNAGYFWTYVTAGDGGYRAVRVERSNSSGYADSAGSATKLATARTIALSGAATGTATGFDGSGNITIPVTSLDASKLTGTASVSTTGNAATATTATNASHATSADKATKAEQDGNGNNIVASYVAAGSEEAGSESAATDIGAFMAARPSFIKSFTYNNGWTDAISMRHRNGSEDGANYGTYIRSSIMTGVSNLLWNHQYSGQWQGERTLIDSVNLAGFIKSAITIYDLVPDGAEAHNAMWGGRDITAAFNNGTVSANIANGTFRDIFPGDYITKQVTIKRAFADDDVTMIFEGGTYTVNWVVADCDYWINKGDTAMTAHHVVIVPQAPIFNARMNQTNTTADGCAGSDMYRKIIPVCARGIIRAFGSDHLLEFRDAITNCVNISYVSSGIPQWTGTPVWWGGWVSVYCNLMSEKMVYGAPICSAGAMDNTMATRQMSAFRLSGRLINYNRQAWWLRDVVSDTHFASADGDGTANASRASGVYGVRPFALLV